VEPVGAGPEAVELKGAGPETVEPDEAETEAVEPVAGKLREDVASVPVGVKGALVKLTKICVTEPTLELDAVDGLNDVGTASVPVLTLGEPDPAGGVGYPFDADFEGRNEVGTASVKEEGLEERELGAGGGPYPLDDCDGLKEVGTASVKVEARKELEGEGNAYPLVDCEGWNEVGTASVKVEALEEMELGAGGAAYPLDDCDGLKDVGTASVDVVDCGGQSVGVDCEGQSVQTDSLMVMGLGKVVMSGTVCHPWVEDVGLPLVTLLATADVPMEGVPDRLLVTRVTTGTGVTGGNVGCAAA
jgi:hypothetical protein